ncbi:hypothetical protein ACFO9Q_19210 [Paenibacillus sp. GCM10023252]|uniref:hypothetical protein n=1 Tax=Paenibacillus sp. GCM10023252 TaxID=3252649 RepID=UPI0036062683
MLMTHMRRGWQLAVRHFAIIIFLFLYQLMWGFFLYRFVDDVVAPLLRRFPDSYPSNTAVSQFLMESQFQLMRTELLQPYAWTLGCILLARMLLTPIFNAGLFYSLHHAEEGKGTQFMLGIRRCWKPVGLLYWTGALLTLAPAWWLLPAALRALLQSGSSAELLQTTLPYAAGWLAWAVLIHMLFLAMQLGAASGEGGILGSLWTALRHFLPYAGISLLMWAIGAGLSAFVTSLSLVWAGLLALVLHQGFHLVRTLVKVWTVAAQLDCLQSRRG